MMITISYKDNNNKRSYYFEAIINSTFDAENKNRKYNIRRI